jgi:hypothetical protein
VPDTSGNNPPPLVFGEPKLPKRRPVDLDNGYVHEYLDTSGRYRMQPKKILKIVVDVLGV